MVFEIFLKFSDSLVFLGFKTWNYTVRWLVNGTILKGFDAMAPFFGALLVFSSTLSWWEMVQILSRWEMVLFWRSRGRFLTRRISFQRRQNSEWWGYFTFPDLEAFYIHPWPFWNHFHVHCTPMYTHVRFLDDTERITEFVISVEFWWLVPYWSVRIKSP